MGQNSHVGETPTTQNNAMSDDPADGHRLIGKPGSTGQTSTEKAPEDDAQDEATIEDFGREGMGVSAKE